MSVSATIGDVWTEFVASRSSTLRDELVVAYAPLVRFVVGRLGIPPTNVLEHEDLISYGVIGLINAIDRFDPSRGIRFETFATSRIRGAVIDELRSLNWLPRSAVARVRQVEGAMAELAQRLGRVAKEEEVVAELQVSTSRYHQMLQEASTMVLSLDAPLNALPVDDGVTSLADLLEDMGTPGPAEHLEQREMLLMLSQAIDQLPERERLLLSLYYQEELTMKEISKLLDVSESRVCQLHMQAILRLRSALNVHQAERQSVRVMERMPAGTADKRKTPALKETHQIRNGTSVR